MKVLLTGAAGRLGRRIWQTLLEAGHEVRATDLRYRGELPGPLEVADLTDHLWAYRLIEGCDAIAHIGNIPNLRRDVQPQEVYRTNTSMNMNVFQAALEMGVANIAFSSTVQVFAGYIEPRFSDAVQRSGLPYLPADGALPARPGNAYALSKQASEDMLRHFAYLNEQGSYVAVRLPKLIRPDDPRAGASASRRSKWHLSTVVEAGSFLLLEDAADLFRLILEKPLPGYRQYFAAVSETPPGMTLAETLATYYADVELRQPAEQMAGLVDVSAITADLGWQPTRSLAVARELAAAEAVKPQMNADARG